MDLRCLSTSLLPVYPTINPVPPTPWWNSLMTLSQVGIDEVDSCTVQTDLKHCIPYSKPGTTYTLVEFPDDPVSGRYWGNFHVLHPWPKTLHTNRLMCHTFV